MLAQQKVQAALYRGCSSDDLPVLWPQMSFARCGCLECLESPCLSRSGLLRLLLPQCRCSDIPYG